MEGRTIKLPEGYRGVVAERQESTNPQLHPDNNLDVIDVDAEDEVELGTVETKGEFDEMVVWDHEATTDTGAELYTRGVEEWLPVAESVRSTSQNSRSNGLWQQIHSYDSGSSR